MRDATLRAAKDVLRSWFRERDDAYLTRVADECRAGIFTYYDSCHCLLGCLMRGYTYGNYENEFERPAELALNHFGVWGIANPPDDRIRRHRTLPIVLAEIRRRNRLARQPADAHQVEVKHVGQD